MNRAAAILVIALVLCMSLLGSRHTPAFAQAATAPDWLEPMKKVHARFTGVKGTFACFGDSITITMAFWAPLAGEPKNMRPEMARAHALVKAYMKPECWNKWKGPEHGNQGAMTIRWAHDHIDQWLKKLNPEAVVMMFGTNDVGQVDLKEYEQKTRDVVDRCLQNGTIVILTTIPPFGGRLDESRKYAELVRRIAKEKHLPLIDYFDAILKRRPDDWNGSLPQFKDTPGDEYQAPTLISRDAVHPSYPKAFQDFSEKSLRHNGYGLRSYLTVLAYADVIGKVLLPESEAAEIALRKSATLYASFDDTVLPNVAGDRSVATRFNHETEKGKFVFEKGFDDKVFRVAKGKGVRGGALEATDVLPRNGRIFYPAKGNIAYRPGGWGGSVSVWINTDPNLQLKTRFCDPVQITQKGANNGGIWFDFNDAKPRDLRLGVFPAATDTRPAIKEEDPNAPLVAVKAVPFKSGEWHHVVLTWHDLDTGEKNATAALYIDGKQIGVIKDQELGMNWELEHAGIYFAVNYIGLLDELAVFNRPLGADEVALLQRKPEVLAGLTK